MSLSDQIYLALYATLMMTDIIGYHDNRNSLWGYLHLFFVVVFAFLCDLTHRTGKPATRPHPDARRWASWMNSTNC